MNHVLANAKAYVALAGSIATVLLNELGPDGTIGATLTAIVAIAGVFAVWRVPNAEIATSTEGE